MKLILWIQVEIVYNESIPTVLIEGLERFAQEQKAMTSCHNLTLSPSLPFLCHHHHQDQSYLVIVAAPAVVAVAVNLQPRKKG